MIDDMLFGTKLPQKVWKPALRRVLTGTWKPMVMQTGAIEQPQALKELGLYLHVPFCKKPCPFCPYNRVQYEKSLYKKFEQAVHQEIDLYRTNLQKIPGYSVGQTRISSLYIGGGTPTLEPQSLAGIISHLKEVFGQPEDICVELHPAAMDEACLDVLQTNGVSMVSIGVESFCDRHLELIGRSHNGQEAREALRRAVKRRFKTVNVDLMFALPLQTLADLDRDLETALESGADQISAYPIFGFPYSDLGKKLGIREIKRPKGSLIRKMLSRIRQRSLEHGFSQCAVWSFIKPGKKKFSSVTRHHYLGFGPSAASMTGNQFYINTFDVEEYSRRLPGHLPVALVAPMDQKLEMAYWFYWKAYEMRFSALEFQDLFHQGLDTVFGRVLRVLKTLGLVVKKGDDYIVTDSASYWIHRLQNEYALNYIDRLWGTCKAVPWPERVVL